MAQRRDGVSESREVIVDVVAVAALDIVCAAREMSDYVPSKTVDVSDTHCALSVPSSSSLLPRQPSSTAACRSLSCPCRQVTQDVQCRERLDQRHSWY